MASYKHPCRYCNTLVDSQAQFCPACGKTNPTGPLRCPKCRSPVRKAHTHCSHCGLGLTITCFHCGESTFYADYCQHCSNQLVAVCPNPKCQRSTAPVKGKCQACGTSIQPVSQEP